MMDYSASGGIGEEGLSVVNGEAGRKTTAHFLGIHHKVHQHQAPNVNHGNNNEEFINTKKFVFVPTWLLPK